MYVWCHWYSKENVNICPEYKTLTGMKVRFNEII